MKFIVQKWMRILGAVSANSVLQADDGGYIIVGGMGDDPERPLCAWMGKVDANGKKLWYRTFDVMNGASEVQKTSDGGYIIAGDAGSSGCLIKTDANGNRIWDKTFKLSSSNGLPGANSGWSGQQTRDGGYILAGYTASGTLSVLNFDAWLIKTDADGNELWDKTFGGSMLDFAQSVQQTADGGYILSGKTSSRYEGGKGTWLIKTYPSGNEEWDRRLPGRMGRSVRQTNDGGYIISGGYIPPCLIKTDSLGNEEWDQFSNLSGADGLQQTSDGGYIITGSYPNSKTTFLIKTDSLGNEEWSKPIANYTLAYAYADASIQQTNDGGYIIAMGDDSLIKTDANGNV